MTYLCIAIAIKGYSSFIERKVWTYENESVNIIYLDANEYLICSRSLIIVQIPEVKMDAQLGNLMEITVSDGKAASDAI